MLTTTNRTPPVFLTSQPWLARLPHELRARVVNEVFTIKGEKGDALLRAAISEAEKRGLKQQMLSAQVHASSFYERFGFAVVSGEFLDAGIPHVDMVRHSH